jgi:subtilisin family serine protease
MKKFLLFFLIAALLQAKPYVTGRLNYYLKKLSPEQNLATIVYFKNQVNFDELEKEILSKNLNAQQRAELTIKRLQQVAKESEEYVDKYLPSIMNKQDIIKIEKYWIFNGFMIETKRKNIDKILENNQIEYIDIDAPILNDDPNLGSSKIETFGEAGVADNLKVVKAHKLWEKGITGKGRLVLGLDTGVDGNHPALNYKWRGKKVPYNQAWFDPANSNFPSDCDEHGTHTMGTMVGLGKNTSDTVGIAIDAEWIGGKVICGSGSVTSSIISAFQWAMNPDGNTNTINDMPDAINCSWYDPDVANECTSVYVNTLTAVETAGIAVVFSAGNSGPNPSTITKPKNININEVNTFCVAAINHTLYMQGNNAPIASFSSRGPSSCGGTGSLLIKPEVSAPGVNIKSTVPGGGYAQTNWSGTSMASPHVAGAVALLKEAFPDLPGYMIKQALYYTAIDLGEPGEDNNYGRGLIDIWEAYNYLLQFTDKTPPEKVADILTIDSTSNSITIKWKTPKDNKGVAGFDVRISISPIDTSNFNVAKKVVFKSKPDTINFNLLTIDSLMPETKYYIAIKAFDNAKNYSQLSENLTCYTLSNPKLLVNKDTMKINFVNSVNKLKDSIKIQNVSSSPSTLNYFIYTKNMNINLNNIKTYISYNSNSTETILGSGGPDKYGYIWYDNLSSKKLKFVWNDIKDIGEKIYLWNGFNTSYGTVDDGQFGPINLGFNFKFYDSTFSQIYINTNGIIGFKPFNKAYGKNVNIPNLALPNGFIAPLWDELDGKEAGEVFYKVFNDKVIVQYENWSRFSVDNPGFYTFQVELNKDNQIKFYYKKIKGVTNDCTIGIENPTGNDGLLVVYNNQYLKDSLAVEIKTLPIWYKTDTLKGMIRNNNEIYYYFEVNDTTLDYGEYLANIVINTNDKENPTKIIPVVLNYKKLVGNEKNIKLTYNLEQNYPNPFNPATTIKFSIPTRNYVSLKIFDILGREVETLINQELDAGEYSYNFNASKLTSGVYIYKISAGDYQKSIKMLLVK